MIYQLVFDLFCQNPEHLPTIDHKDRNRRNNYYKNLRPCTFEQSAQNREPRKNHSSRFKGVSLHQNGGWLTRVSWNAEKYTYSYYSSSEIDCAHAYDKKAKEVFDPDFCYLNFQDTDVKSDNDNSTKGVS
jgi:hypothetical protein